jgi:hypothetical protein
LCLLLFLLGMATGLWRAGRGPISLSHSVPLPAVLTIDRLRQLAELTTLAVDVSEIQQTAIQGYVGGICAVLLVKGEVRITTDLSQARFESVDDTNKTASLILDPPVVSTASLDFDHTSLFAVSEQGLWQITPGNQLYDKVVNRAFAQAQHAVADAGNQPDLLNKARHKTETVLQGFFSALGWKVSIRWSDEASSQAERQYIEP